MSVADTTDEAAQMQAAVFRDMSPDDRLLRAFEMSDLVVEIAETGIRTRHPDYTDEQVHLALLRLRLGDDLFQRANPGAPLLAS